MYSAVKVRRVAFSGTSGSGAAVVRPPPTVVSLRSATVSSGRTTARGFSATSFVVVGKAGTIIVHNNGAWSSFTTTTNDNFTAVWGSSATDIWAVGEKGAIFHFDGSSTTSHAITGMTKHLYGIWGSSATDIWAVGKDATIVHYDGTGWSLVTPPTGVNTDLNAVWGTSGMDVWIVGENGTILHYSTAP